MTTTATADTILAIGLGRYKSVACIYSRANRDPRTGPQFRTLDTKPEAAGRTG